MNVTERFLKYVSFDTQSDEGSDTSPSTEKQKSLGEYLVQELSEMGLIGVKIDANGYVYGFLPATVGQENAPTIGLIAHMDTSPDVSGKDVSARIVCYEGGDIPLSESVTMRVEDFSFLENYIGQQLIVTDGNTLLGADDKAGIAEIISAISYLKEHPEIPHGKIAVAFTPDEEIGRGADLFDVQGFAADYAYTVDGGELGEIEYENFNAAGAVFEIYGVNIHPGSAKNHMKNAVLIANELISMFPPAETPAHTEGYEGFYHVSDINGNEGYTKVYMIIRDHDRDLFEKRKETVRSIVNYLNSKYGDGTIVLEMKDSYYNMKEKILPHMYIVDNAVDAMKACSVTPKVMAIRGGTDGARLSFMGLPCPNLSTGGANFHGIYEFVSVQSMEKMVEVLIEIVRRK